MEQTTNHILVLFLTIGNITKIIWRVVEKPTKKIVPEIDITQLLLQQQQQQQNEKQKKELLEAGKRPESYEKRVAHPFEQKPEINNEVVTPPPLLPPPPPAVSATPPIAPFKSFTAPAPTAKSVMDAKLDGSETVKWKHWKKWM